jgi:tetratricopeptide (TPR) repeat protein
MGSQTGLRRWLLLACLLALLCACPARPAAIDQAAKTAAAKPARTLELRGQVLTVQGRSLPSYTIIWVGLQGATTPFNKGTYAMAGKFKFSKLLPGTYTVITGVRGQGQAYQTVEVTPGLADRKGRVYVFVALRQSTEDLQRRYTVSVRQLAITEGARNEYRKALGALGKRDADQAIQHLEKAVERSPGFWGAINLMGTIHYQRRELAKAEQLFREALALDPNAYDPMVNLGGTLLDLRRYREALVYNIGATNRRPTDALAHAQLGLNLVAFGRYENAIPYLVRAKKLDPAHFSKPQLVLAEVYMHQGEMAKAAAELKEFMRLHPDDPLAVQLREEMKKQKSDNP